MRVGPFLQGAADRSTLGSLEEVIDFVEPTEALFCFAYCTSSGYTAFHNRLGGKIWNVPTRWLMGIDYGRSQPSALREIDSRPHATVRIHDGMNVIARAGFFPRQDFHVKACFFHNANTGAASLLAGSGNFSFNGLSRSIECGIAVTTTTRAEQQRHIQPLFGAAEALWDRADNLDGLLARYLQLWTPGSVPRSGRAPSPAQLGGGAYDKFWIEVGYVTPNRRGREGNQFDMPRGVHAFFGLPTRARQPLNSTIGNVTFVGNGPPLTRALRLGNNAMEKLTLPFPEAYPFGTYSGKILEFTRRPGGFSIDAFELDDFGKLLRQSQRAVTLKMGSGRTYGYRS